MLLLHMGFFKVKSQIIFFESGIYLFRTILCMDSHVQIKTK
jgi:hypothetical protein